jgi:predicted nucleic acid-binding protein
VACFFLDSSALVKRYVAEIGSAWVRGLTARGTGHDLFLARITGVEVLSALVRHVPPLPPTDLAYALAAFRHDLQNRFRLVAASQQVLNRAMRLALRHRLRGYDAVQLAAALEASRRASALGLPVPTVVSADANLNAAAGSEGFVVDNPNLHP